MLGWGWDGVSIEGLGWDIFSSLCKYFKVEVGMGVFYFLALRIVRRCGFVDPKSIALVKQSMLIHLVDISLLPHLAFVW